MATDVGSPGYLRLPSADAGDVCVPVRVCGLILGVCMVLNVLVYGRLF